MSTPMTAKLDAILAALATGQTLTRACTDAFTTQRHLTEWISAQPNGKTLYASLLLAQADGASHKADEGQAEMVRRIDGGLIRNRGLADLEYARLRQLTQTAAQLRNEAARVLPLQTPASQRFRPTVAAERILQTYGVRTISA
jgi:hypothetical protein